MNYNELEQKANEWIDNLKIKRSENTIKQYQKSLEWFFEYLKDNDITEITEQAVYGFKNSMENEIVKNRQNPPTQPKGESWRTERPLTKFSTANTRLKAVNALFRSLDRKDLIVPKIKDSAPNIGKETMTDLDYLKLLDYTKSEKMKLIIETLTYTGIRISELEDITVESLKNRYTETFNKGRNRIVYIPKRLADKLKAYCKANGIKKGIIFRGQPLKDKDGNYIDRDGNIVKEPMYKLISQSYIRDEMKRIAGQARMKKSKVFPHSFRHLFSKHYSAMPDSDYYILPQLLGHAGATVTNEYTKLNPDELLKIVDDLEVFTNKKLKEAQKVRNKNKKLAEAKKKRNQSKKNR